MHVYLLNSEGFSSALEEYISAALGDEDEVWRRASSIRDAHVSDHDDLLRLIHSSLH
jgi:hypothetical protein